ncbi:hypothetical protein JYU34_008266 [Plutella xylostella]|uniref:C2H2-type domain-containing protein n=1 Tax=Plutella xylostella TaxID=51655 RepID=A0ABQ7QP60_PLUXY|nr:hypothetical protein JYU34_008266 [Plutella xylostella]
MAQHAADFICDYCDRGFTRKYNLRIHIENCHLNTVTSCGVCNQSFGSTSGLQQHLNRGHNRNHQGFPECDLCGRIFKRKQNIVSHMITIHLQGSEIRCLICLKTFTTQRNLKRHINQLHNPDFEYLECDDCSKIFKGKHSLINHIQAMHNPANKQNCTCHVCDRTYTNTRNLKRHIETCHGERGEYKCCFCTKVYTSNQSLRRHQRIRHNPKITNVKSIPLEVLNGVYDEDVVKNHNNGYQCRKCKKTFYSEPVLRQHMKLAHSFSSFYKYCRSVLLKQETLKLETQANKFYNCEFCNYVFSNVYELKNHMHSNHDVEYCLSTCNVCFNKFYSKETACEHKKICLPPADANACSHCDKLFTDVSSLQFHARIFHPQSQITDQDVTSTNTEDVTAESSVYNCPHCQRVYYSDRSLKHHMKLKHSEGEAVECPICGKICSNKYYLASHTKLVHEEQLFSKCEYCDKQFKSRRNVRRHIEFTHLGMQRYKCIECETLFKEKRSLRKHVRTKHSDSKSFPQCHICEKRFESAKSCKIHLKLVHSFNLNTHPCHKCSVSFTSYESLRVHLQTNHLAEEEIYKCEECNLVFEGHEKFENHNELYHVSLVSKIKQKILPRCILCMKDFSTRKTLKRHIKKFHTEFDPDELATFGSRRRIFTVDCEHCVKKFTDDSYVSLYQKLRRVNSRDSPVFKCEFCGCSYSVLEFSIQNYRLQSADGVTKTILSELCTTEMSEGESEDRKGGFRLLDDSMMEPESTTTEIKKEVIDNYSDMMSIKMEPVSP